jgi:hypothetical protein
MMPALLVSSDVPPPVRRYLIATAGKKRIDLDNNGLFAGDSRLIGYRNPFARQKTSSITSGLCFLRRRRNTAGNGRNIAAILTTRHMFSPNERRQTAFLLPIWLPNPDFLRRESDPGPRRGGGRPSASVRNALPITSHRKFCPKGAPYPISVAEKMGRACGGKILRKLPGHNFTQQCIR